LHIINASLCIQYVIIIIIGCITNSVLQRDIENGRSYACLESISRCFLYNIIAKWVFWQCIWNIHTWEKLLSISASERSWCIILKCPSLIGTAMTVICTSTMSPTWNCAGSVGLKLIIHMWDDGESYYIDLQTVVVPCSVAYSIRLHCLLRESRYLFALKIESLSDPQNVKMEQWGYRGHHVMRWNSIWPSLSLNML